MAWPLLGMILAAACAEAALPPREHHEKLLRETMEAGEARDRATEVVECEVLSVAAPMRGNVAPLGAPSGSVIWDVAIRARVLRVHRSQGASVTPGAILTIEYAHEMHGLPGAGNMSDAPPTPGETIWAHLSCSGLSCSKVPRWLGFLSPESYAAALDSATKEAARWGVETKPAGETGAEDSEAVEAESELDPATLEARLVVVVGKRSFIPIPGSIPEGLPAPKAMNAGFSAWIQPVVPPSADATTAPGRWRVIDTSDGTLREANEKGVAVLTLGQPHSGALEGGDGLTEPACGDPVLHAELDLKLPTGIHVATPMTGSAPVVLQDKGKITALEKAARAELESLGDWTKVPSGVPTESAEEIVRSVRVLRYEAKAAAFHVIEATLVWGDGPCGGVEQAWRAIYAADGESLGRHLGSFQSESFSKLEAIVDVDGDGTPELVTSSHPDRVRIVTVKGSVVALQDIASCDCGC